MVQRRQDQLIEKLRRYALPVVQAAAAIANILRFVKDLLDS